MQLLRRLFFWSRPSSSQKYRDENSSAILSRKREEGPNQSIATDWSWLTLVSGLGKRVACWHAHRSPGLGWTPCFMPWSGHLVPLKSLIPAKLPKRRVTGPDKQPCSNVTGFLDFFCFFRNFLMWVFFFLPGVYPCIYVCCLLVSYAPCSSNSIILLFWISWISSLFLLCNSSAVKGDFAFWRQLPVCNG